MNIKVRDLKQTETIKNTDKLMVLVDDQLNLVKNITKEEFVTNIISTAENNALIQEPDGNLYVNTSEITDSLTALNNKFTNEIGDLSNLNTEDKTNLVAAINEAGLSSGGANTDLSNLSATGEKHFLNYTQITNCLLEVPQRINIQLNNGTLTLKAGSVVIFPYGTEDKTAQFPVGSTFFSDNFKVVDTQFSNGKFFVWAEIQSDRNATNSFSGTYSDIAVGINTSNNLEQEKSSTWTSGTTDSLSTSNTFHFWYDTANNFIFRKLANGTTSSGYVSLPFCLMANVGGSGFSRITQTFNGFGYIGSTAWMDKGVKGLSCDGRNADGTLKNLKWVNPVLVTRNNPLGANLGWFRIYSSVLVDMNISRYYEQEEEPINATYALWYKPSENIMYYVAGQSGVWTKSHWIYGITATADSSGRITSFNPKQSFRAAEVSQVEMLIYNNKFEINAYKNGNSWYRIFPPDNTGRRWCEQGGFIAAASPGTTLTVTLLKSFVDTNYFVVRTNLNGSATNGAPGYITGVDSVTTTNFTFRTDGGNYSNGNKWMAVGYIA